MANSAGSASKEKEKDLDATTEATIQAMKDLIITVSESDKGRKISII